jgi:hypothetical protein
MKREKKPTMSHPYTIVVKPPKVSPVVNIVITPVKIDITENKNTKFHSTLHTTIQIDSSISKRTCNSIIF